MLMIKQYKLDDAKETYDTATPTTIACPLLPGQMVNMLEVPIEIIDAPQRVCSASADLPTTIELPMTTNPEDRYKKVYRKTPTKLPRYYCSSDALRERFNAEGSRLSQETKPWNRPSSRGSRSIKRVRREEPEYQRPGACKIDVSLEDIAMLTNMPDFDQSAEEVPELRPFSPCATSPVQERPATRGGFMTDFTKGLGFSFFGSKRPSNKNAHRLSEDITMEFEPTPPQLPQYDGAFDELYVANTQWPLSPPMSELADEEAWPLPPLHSFRPAATFSPVDGPSTPTSSIPTLNLDNQLQVLPVSTQPLLSPALSASTTPDDYHPGFGPNSNNCSFDMSSPTFTAETMSSSPGIPTPDRFRLSTHAPDISSSINTSKANEINENNFSTGLDDLSRRLSALTSESEFEFDDTESDTESLFQVSVPAKPKFYAQPLYLQETEGAGFEPTNTSCLTLKPASRHAFSMKTGNLDVGLEKGRGIADEFSSDVLGALGIAA